jgi:hypothetical protein
MEEVKEDEEEQESEEFERDEAGLGFTKKEDEMTENYTEDVFTEIDESMPNEESRNEDSGYHKKALVNVDSQRSGSKASGSMEGPEEASGTTSRNKFHSSVSSEDVEIKSKGGVSAASIDWVINFEANRSSAGGKYSGAEESGNYSNDFEEEMRDNDEEDMEDEDYGDEIAEKQHKMRSPMEDDEDEHEEEEMEEEFEEEIEEEDDIDDEVYDEDELPL